MKSRKTGRVITMHLPGITATALKRSAPSRPREGPAMGEKLMKDPIDRQLKALAAIESEGKS